MIRKLMASSAMLALMTAASFGVAQAQTQPAEPAQQPPAVTQDQQAPAMTQDQQQDPAAANGAESADQPTAEIAPSDSPLTPDQPTLASAFMGKAVYSNENQEADNIGNVNDLIVSSEGSITHAVVGVGGFLGIGEKDVAVPFDELQVVERDGDLRLIYSATREQLEQAQAFDAATYEPQGRAQQEQEQQQATENASGGAQMPADQAASGTPAAVNTDQAAGTTPAPADQNTQQTAQTTQTEPAANSADQAEQSQSATAPVEGFTAFNATDQIRASTLMGKEIFGAENESIGEVGDLVMQSDGKTRAAVIDVGGFLGMGEKEVAIPFDQIQMTQDGNEPRLTVAMTREQLEQAPAYQRPEEMANAQNAGAPADPNAPQTDTATTGVPTNTTDQQQAATQQPADGNAQQPAPAGQEQMAQQEQFVPATQDISAEMLMGKDVVSNQDESLGEVGDVVFTQSGEIQAVVVDVGGFLGIGEKSVAINFDQLNVQKNTDGDLRLQVNASQEQLQNAPEYNAEQAAAQ